jgi:hypothetical protein
MVSMHLRPMQSPGAALRERRIQADAFHYGDFTTSLSPRILWLPSACRKPCYHRTTTPRGQGSVAYPHAGRDPGRATLHRSPRLDPEHPHTAGCYRSVRPDGRCWRRDATVPGRADRLAVRHCLRIRLARPSFVHGADRSVRFGVRTAGHLKRPQSPCHYELKYVG